MKTATFRLIIIPCLAAGAWFGFLSDNGPPQRPQLVFPHEWGVPQKSSDGWLYVAWTPTGLASGHYDEQGKLLHIHELPQIDRVKWSAYGYFSDCITPVEQSPDGVRFCIY